LFIDLPNVLIMGDRSEYFSLPTVLGHIDEHALGDSSLNRAYMYGHKYEEGLRTRPREFDFNELVTQLDEYRFQLRGCPVYFHACSKLKDVDVHITNDIWRSCAHFTRNCSQRRTLRHVLVSGDGDYLRSYEHIRKEFGDLLDLQLHIYSWRDKCNGRAHAHGTVYYLDDLPGIRDPLPDAELAD
jgi:hypothetical protein